MSTPAPVVALMDEHLAEDHDTFPPSRIETLQRALAERETLENNLAKLLETLAFESRPCKHCGVKIWLINYREAKDNRYRLAAVNHDGSLHAETCAKRGAK